METLPLALRSFWRGNQLFLWVAIACGVLLLTQACTASRAIPAHKATASPTGPNSSASANLPVRNLNHANTTSFMVFFDHEEATLSSSATATLKAVVDATPKASQGPIRVIGHAGHNEGGLASKINPVALSLNRAEAVKAYLVSQGIPDNRIRATGVGKGLPLVPNGAKAAAKNRRSEVILTSAPGAPAMGGALSAQLPIIENSVFTEVSGTPQYIVGSGDILDITMWRGLKSDKFLTTVRPDGKISFGFIEDAPIDGLTITEIDDLLTDRLSKFLKFPRIDILIEEYNSKSASIFGGVSKGNVFGKERTGPGTYILEGKITLLDLLIRAGGFADNANLNRVEVIRGDGQKVVVNLARVIFEGDTAENLILDDGDVIFIPLQADNRVFVVGEVNRQGTFIVGEPVTVLQSISLAGGFTDDANRRKVYIFRGRGTQTQLLVSNVKHIMDTGDRTQDVLIANNDVIVVPTSAIGKWNLWMERLRPTLRNIEEVSGILLDLDAMTPGSGTGTRGPFFRD